jgi:uncharacterized integral membrane protein
LKDRDPVVLSAAYLGDRTMRTLKYIGRLLGEFFDFAWQNKAWWIIPIVLVLLILTVFIVTGTSVAPFIYTLF